MGTQMDTQDAQEEIITIHVDHDMAWTLRGRITPGPSFIPIMARDAVVAFRTKVNDALIRLSDEKDLKKVDIYLTLDEAWLVDQVVAFDGRGGPGTAILLEIFRGLWENRYDVRLASSEVPDLSYPRPVEGTNEPDGVNDPTLAKRDESLEVQILPSKPDDEDSGVAVI